MRFFDYYLKGKDTNITKEKPVEYYLMGDTDQTGNWNYWTISDFWPPESKLTEFYFHPDNKLSKKLPTKNNKPTKFLYNPKNPVPTWGGGNLIEFFEGKIGPRVIANRCQS